MLRFAKSSSLSGGGTACPGAWLGGVADPCGGATVVAPGCDAPVEPPESPPLRFACCGELPRSRWLARPLEDRPPTLGGGTETMAVGENVAPHVRAAVIGVCRMGTPAPVN